MFWDHALFTLKFPIKFQHAIEASIFEFLAASCYIQLKGIWSSACLKFNVIVLNKLNMRLFELFFLNPCHQPVYRSSSYKQAQSSKQVLPFDIIWDFHLSNLRAVLCGKLFWIFLMICCQIQFCWYILQLNWKVN